MDNNAKKEHGVGCLTVATIGLVIIIVIAALSDFVEKNTGALIVLYRTCYYNCYRST